VQPKKNYRHADRNQRKENCRDHVGGKHVGKQTNGERHDASALADEFDGQHQPGQPPDRAQKALQIAKSGVSESCGLVIDKGTQGAPQGDCGRRGGRCKAGDNAAQIAGKK